MHRGVLGIGRHGDDAARWRRPPRPARSPAGSWSGRGMQHVHALAARARAGRRRGVGGVDDLDVAAELARPGCGCGQLGGSAVPGRVDDDQVGVAEVGRAARPRPGRAPASRSAAAPSRSAGVGRDDRVDPLMDRLRRGSRRPARRRRGGPASTAGPPRRSSRVPPAASASCRCGRSPAPVAPSPPGRRRRRCCGRSRPRRRRPAWRPRRGPADRRCPRCAGPAGDQDRDRAAPGDLGPAPSTDPGKTVLTRSAPRSAAIVDRVRHELRVAGGRRSSGPRGTPWRAAGRSTGRRPRRPPRDRRSARLAVGAEVHVHAHRVGADAAAPPRRPPRGTSRRGRAPGACRR